jgi:hypothetical protein
LEENAQINDTQKHQWQKDGQYTDGGELVEWHQKVGILVVFERLDGGFFPCDIILVFF